MKVIKKGRLYSSEKTPLTVRVEPETLKLIDEICKKNDLSRQVVIEAILKQVVIDPEFVLEVD